MKSFVRRDLTIIDIGVHTIVIACDSCGGVGLKDGDILKVEPYYTGKLTARVALTEVLCSGAKPVAVFDTVTNEMNPTGQEIIRGIKDELVSAGLTDVIISGSTEENFKTIMTGIGISVVGICDKDLLRFHHAKVNDKILLFGRPCLGNEVGLDNRGYYKEIQFLLTLQGVREIVPVGSKGICFEANTLAEFNGMKFSAFDTDIDLNKSAGPVTCMIALCDEDVVNSILEYDSACAVIGEILAN